MSNSKSQVITLEQASALSNSESKPIVWKDFGIYLDKKLSVEVHDQPLSQLDTSLLSQVVKYKVCKSCHRPIGADSLESHLVKCSEMKNKKHGFDDDAPISSLKRKKGKLLELDASSVDSSRNTTPAPTTPNSSGPASVSRPKKKYKKSQTQKEKEAANAAAAAAAATGKKRKAVKPKSTGKHKGPVDVEKQCGVPLPNGGFCARSLTCKTHSMGAKRAVLGRSAPYDVLLQQYQKRNQAKLAANNALAAQRRENEAFNGNEDSELSNSRILDPDEETYLVLEGLSKNQPMPLERKVVLPVRNRHKFLYMREAYANALIINGSNNTSTNNGNTSNDQTLANQAISGSIGGLQGRCALVNVDSQRVENDSQSQSSASITGEQYQVRAPSKEVLLTAQHNAMQQQLFQQQVMRLQQQQMLLMKQRQKQMQQQQSQPQQPVPKAQS